jgi:hypothetical protein
MSKATPRSRNQGRTSKMRMMIATSEIIYHHITIIITLDLEEIAHSYSSI